MVARFFSTFRPSLARSFLEIWPCSATTSESVHSRVGLHQRHSAPRQRSVVNTLTKSHPATYFLQTNPKTFLGTDLSSNEALTVHVTAGSLVILRRHDRQSHAGSQCAIWQEVSGTGPLCVLPGWRLRGFRSASGSVTFQFSWVRSRARGASLDLPPLAVRD